jgi:60 kDa SS-A/Ro ribonucleoprotein
MSTNDPFSKLSLGATPQSQPIPGRTGMVKNSAGGYSFEKDDWVKAEDFIILGTAGGTFYMGQDKLTLENAAVLLKLAKSDGARLAALACEISVSTPPRAMSNNGPLFALAAVSALGDAAGVQAVKKLLPEVARTTDHLSKFFGYRKQLKSKPAANGKGTAIVSSRAFRTTMASWLTSADVNDVAFRACKARQRKTPAGEAFDLRDVLRITHKVPGTPERQALFGWLTGKVTDEQAARVLPAVDNFLVAKAVKTPAEAIRIITERRVPWEFLPSEVLSDKGVWEALAATTGLTAVLRNLARMTRIGTLAPFAKANDIVIKRLTDPVALAKARVHPMNVYLTLRLYNGGISQPHPKAPPEYWTPVPAILDALEETYDLSYGYTEPSGRQYLIVIDSSGSMTWSQVTPNGSKLGTAYQVANGVALTLKRIEGDNVHVIDVDTSVHQSRITKRSRLADTQGSCPSGGGTDMSLGFTWAMEQKLRLDGFLTLTDNETWAGRRWHPVQAYEAYRRSFNPVARNIVVSMTSAGHSIGDPSDPFTLQVAGLDSSLPTLVTGFIRGDR